MAEKSRIYLDSCCFIDIAKQSIGILPTARDVDVWYLWKILEAHKDGEIAVFTSMLSIVECTHADGNMTPKVRDLFIRLLMSGQYVTLVQPTPFLAADGRDLRWKHGVTLKGADYLHIASGLAVKCAEFLTTDGRILSNGKLIDRLGMRLATPSKTVLLPDKYRQGDMLDDKVASLRRPAGPTASA